jgi:hypothetical protein
LELVAAVAIGLNPYIGALVLAALAAFTNRAPETAVLGATPNYVLIAFATAAGLAAPVDFILGKLVRFAPRVRRASQAVAPVAGGLAAVAFTRSALPLPLVFAAGAALAWSIAAMVTTLAARGSRSRTWAGLGHVPVLMGAATAAASIVPLALANGTVGLILALGALIVLLAGSFVPALAGARGGQPGRTGGRTGAGRELSAGRAERVRVRVNA